MLSTCWFSIVRSVHAVQELLQTRLQWLLLRNTSVRAHAHDKQKDSGSCSTLCMLNELRSSRTRKSSAWSSVPFPAIKRRDQSRSDRYGSSNGRTVAIEYAEGQLDDRERELHASHDLCCANEISWRHREIHQMPCTPSGGLAAACTFRDLVKTNELEGQLDILQIALHVEVELVKVVPGHQLLRE